ncbi:ribosome 60S biogenesis N-terminal-domain-containing protein [Xylariaceae sp. FL0255]|nr:ribosome 60S biogenesis N-terminal-domain-containing protein [Xylariaceae sp. FL0255]
MPKRKSFTSERHGKKQKTAHIHEPPTSEQVHTARQLQQLLTFEQDLRKARHGLQSFKNVLDSIVADDEKKPENLHIVLDFLNVAAPRRVDDGVPIYLPDIIDTWSMAAQTTNENLMSAVPVVLALLLKIISSSVDLVPYGLGICRTLLLKPQQDLIAKNLSSDKGKDFIVSPTLRLLKELISLDGGALAAPLFRARNNTFKSLARNMGLRYIGEGIEDPQRPSVRTNAIRFLLAALTLLHYEAKRDLLSQKDILAALMRHLPDDPPSLISEILNTLKEAVVKDKKLPKDAKIRILNAHSLSRIASLYGYAKDIPPAEETTESSLSSVEDAAHDLLVATCTDSTVGIFRQEQGYYPDGIDAHTFAQDAGSPNSSDFGLDSIPWIGKFQTEIPVRNMLLAEFIQSLKPWSNTKQSELLLAIFENSPELIAHYFLHKQTFTFDPSPSPAWMGYAALLYNVVQLPVPPYFGMANGYAAVPPPASVILDNIIPRPITLKAITRCLTNKSEIVSFYAIRILMLALQKLDKALEMHRHASASTTSIWQEAARRLTDGFYQRIPDVKDVMVYYRSLVDDDVLQREAASRLILLYFEVIPQVALRAKLDVSSLLLAAIKRVEAFGVAEEQPAQVSLELEHLCGVAKYSPSMRWFAKGLDMPLSPFITLLRIYTEHTTGLSGEELSQVLSYVADEYQLVESQPSLPGLNPLITALRKTGSTDPSIWVFLDNCAERCARTPTKYLEMIEQHLEKQELDQDQSGVTSPLLMTIAEQLPFFVSSSPAKDVLKQLATFLRNYLRCSLDAGVDRVVLDAIRGLLVEGLKDEKVSTKLTVSKKSKAISGDTGLEDDVIDDKSSRERQTSNKPSDEMSLQELEERLAVPILDSKENALLRWSTKPPEELVEEGYATSLILLLSSEHLSVRKEALSNIIKMAAKIKESPYEENEQVWLLLMELAESARDLITDGPVPSILVIFACRALDVLKNPLHCLYEKVNIFLTSGPTWRSDNIPLMQAILQDGPTLDGTYYTEISWLLTFLLDSLRTQGDMGLFHQRRVFERLFSLSTNPYMGPNLRTQILRVLYRSTCIQGGSDTVMTRFGAVSWLEAQRAASDNEVERELYHALTSRLWETCDQKRLAAWGKGSIEKIVK